MNPKTNEKVIPGPKQIVYPLVEKTMGMWYQSLTIPERLEEFLLEIRQGVFKDESNNSIALDGELLRQVIWNPEGTDKFPIINRLQIALAYIHIYFIGKKCNNYWNLQFHFSEYEVPLAALVRLEESENIKVEYIPDIIGKVKPKIDNTQRTPIQIKFKILRICQMYDQVCNQMGAVSMLNDAFLKSPDHRRAIATTGAVLIPNLQENQGFTFTALTDVVKENAQAGQMDSINFFSMVEKGMNSPQLTSEPPFLYVPGIGMEIPEKAKVAIAYDRIWPMIFVQKKGTGEQFNMAENSYSLDIVYDQSLKISTQGPANFQQTPKTNLSFLNYAKLGKQIKGPGFDSDLSNFGNLVVNFPKDLDDYDVVVTLPYITPRADFLVTMNFGDDKQNQTELSS